jgi:hypothetical protein
MKKHEHVDRLNTVTPFSRTFAAILFVSIPIITFFIGYDYGMTAQKAESVMNKASASMMDMGAGMASGTSEMTKLQANAVLAPDQKPGRSVMLTRVVLEKPGYVVVHRDQAGKPGKVIGGSQVLTGTVDMQNVTLTEAVVDGDTLHAALYTDDGDNVREVPGADVAVEMDGQPVIATFMVDTDAMPASDAADLMR